MEEQTNAVVAAPDEGARGSRRQKQQANLTKQGEKLPGVAEAMVAYRRFAPHAPATTLSVAPVPYSTGSNAS